MSDSAFSLESFRLKEDCDNQQTIHNKVRDKSKTLNIHLEG